MSYQIKFTDNTNPSKIPIVVPDSSTATVGGLVFPGKNYTNYGTVLGEDFLHLLENFASATAPYSPVQGQLWYNTGNNILNVYDGTAWNPAGSLKRGSSENIPAVQNSSVGDLWVNTTTSQLYLFSGSAWILVGPQFSSGARTGPIVESIIDTTNTGHNVLSFYANDYRIAIISKETFTPKITITGFSTIKEGFNLSTVDSTSTTSPSKIWGVAEKADALLVGSETIPAINFLRGNAPSTSSYPITIQNDGGITLGSDASFNIGVSTNSTVLYSKNNGNSIDFNLNNTAGATTTVLHLTASGKVGINNINPQASLDVTGSIATSDGLSVTSTTNSTSTTTGSIKTLGGLGIEQDSFFGGSINAHGGILTNNIVNGTPTAGTVLQPGSDSATMLYDIGTPTRRFRNIYAQNFVGTFNGNFTGSLTGSITGSAAQLQTATVFSITGDVSSTNSISFNGVTETGTATFQTKIGTGIITSQTVATDSQATDQILAYRAGTGLVSMSKQVMFNHIATIPVGTILPYAGPTPPPGYLFCDGSEVPIGTYSKLFSAIGYAFKAVATLQGTSTFALPDLRGRFALGRDNMNNGIQVPSNDLSGTNISTITTPAGRVSSAAAQTVGASSGVQSVTVGVDNLPEHQHKFGDGVSNFYSVNTPAQPADNNATPNYGVSGTTPNTYGLDHTGGINTTETLSQAINTMNPYQTINYIIFTGNTANISGIIT